MLTTNTYVNDFDPTKLDDIDLIEAIHEAECLVEDIEFDADTYESTDGLADARACLGELYKESIRRDLGVVDCNSLSV
jgi:hypothetical protein